MANNVTIQTVIVVATLHLGWDGVQLDIYHIFLTVRHTLVVEALVGGCLIAYTLNTNSQVLNKQNVSVEQRSYLL